MENEKACSERDGPELRLGTIHVNESVRLRRITVTATLIGANDGTVSEDVILLSVPLEVAKSQAISCESIELEIERGLRQYRIKDDARADIVRKALEAIESTEVRLEE